MWPSIAAYYFHVQRPGYLILTITCMMLREITSILTNHDKAMTKQWQSILGMSSCNGKHLDRQFLDFSNLDTNIQIYLIQERILWQTTLLFGFDKQSYTDTLGLKYNPIEYFSHWVYFPFALFPLALWLYPLNMNIGQSTTLQLSHIRKYKDYLLPYMA